MEKRGRNGIGAGLKLLQMSGPRRRVGSMILRVELLSKSYQQKDCEAR